MNPGEQQGSAYRNEYARQNAWTDGKARPDIGIMYLTSASTVVNPSKDPNPSKSDKYRETHGTSSVKYSATFVPVKNYVLSCSWSSGLTPPYETASVTMKDSPLGGHAPQHAYLVVSVPSDSPVDPSRILWLGKMTDMSFMDGAMDNGMHSQTLSMEFEGFYDIASMSDVLSVGSKSDSENKEVRKGPGIRRSFGTIFNTMNDIYPLRKEAVKTTQKTKKLGSFLQLMWQGGAGAFGQSQTGLARILWPQISRTGRGTLKYMSDFIGVLSNTGYDIKSGGYYSPAERNNSGLVMSPVPGVISEQQAGILVSTTRAKSQLGTIISGTFVADTSIVELFPTLLYDPSKATTRHALVYRMKPFRNQTGGEFIKFQQSLREAVNSKRIVLPGKGASTRAWRDFAGTLIRRQQVIDEHREKWDNVLASTFGPPVWGECKASAVKVDRDFIFNMTRNYSLSNQVNVVSASTYTPNNTYAQNVFAGLPLMSKHNVLLEGVRMLSPQWRYLLYDKDGAGKPVIRKDPKTGRDTVTLATQAHMARAVALEAAQSMMNNAEYATGQCRVAFNPDIRPGRAVRFKNLLMSNNEHVADRMHYSFDDQEIKAEREYLDVPDPEGNATTGHYWYPKSTAPETPAETSGAPSANDVASSSQRREKKRLVQNSYAYCTRVTHSFDVGPRGEISIRTSFSYEKFTDSESERGYTETVLDPVTPNDEARYEPGDDDYQSTSESGIS